MCILRHEEDDRVEEEAQDDRDEEQLVDDAVATDAANCISLRTRKLPAGGAASVAAEA